MNRISAGIFALLLICSTSAKSILIRDDYDVFGSDGYNRYLNVVGDFTTFRHENIGNIQLYTPAKSKGIDSISFSNDCTGTLISANLILTAAHCFDGGPGVVNSFTINSSLSAMPIAPGQQVFFAGGLNLSTDERYATANIRYAVQVDRLSIHPGYQLTDSNLTSFDADLALLRVYGAPRIGTLPNYYIPINTDPVESFQFDLFGITVGYGSTGNGRDGTTSTNRATEKRGGFTEFGVDPNHRNHLVAEFVDPRQYSSRGLPEDFLGAALGAGDSGGPLVMNIGAGDKIFGVAHGGGDRYGNSSWWTSVSNYSSWILSESAVLNQASAVTPSGSTPDSPLLPQIVRDISDTISEKIFTFFAGTAGFGVFLDPTFSETVEIYIDSGPLISALYLPENVFAEGLLLFDVSMGEFVDSGLTLTNDSWLDLEGSFTALRLVGLTDSGNAPLTLGFEFADAGRVEMRWWSISAVPGPASWSTLLIGLLIIGTLTRRREAHLRYLERMRFGRE